MLLRGMPTGCHKRAERMIRPEPPKKCFKKFVGRTRLNVFLHSFIFKLLTTEYAAALLRGHYVNCTLYFCVLCRLSGTKQLLFIWFKVKITVTLNHIKSSWFKVKITVMIQSGCQKCVNFNVSYHCGFEFDCHLLTFFMI